MTCVYFETLTLGGGGSAEPVAALLREALALRGVRGGWSGVPLAASVNGGDLALRAGFADEAACLGWLGDPFWRRPETRRVLSSVAARNSIRYRPGTGRSRAGGAGGVWRGLVFAVSPDAGEAAVARLEAALLRMPAHIDDIRAWRLSRALAADGERRWTHMWEQAFDDVAPLRGRYLTDPIHWGHVDAWFDVEHPDWIVDPFLIHCIAAAGDAIAP